MNVPRFEPRALVELTPHSAAGVRILATDVDGTITDDGALAPELLVELAQLAAAGIEVILVSGRPAGEVVGLCRYLPGVRRGIAENGLVAVQPDELPQLLYDTDETRSQFLARVSEMLEAGGFALRLASDACFRLADVAYERDGRSDETLAKVAACANAQGIACVWSNVHVHFSTVTPDKGAGLARVLAVQGIETSSVATIGDALNDAGLFRRSRFPISVATADLVASLDYLDEACRPSYIAAQRGHQAFLALASRLRAAQKLPF